jgi:hypothetical protein
MLYGDGSNRVRERLNNMPQRKGWQKQQILAMAAQQIGSGVIAKQQSNYIESERDGDGNSYGSSINASMTVVALAPAS